MTPEDMHRITGVTPSQESPEVRRQLQEDQRGGDWLGWVLLAMAVFLVFVMVVWFGVFWLVGVV